MRWPGLQEAGHHELHVAVSDAMTTTPTAPPRHRWTTILAWSLWGLSLLVTAAGMWMLWLTRAAPRPDPQVFDWVLVLDRVAFPLALVVGAVIASRRPRLPIGWLLLVIGLGFPVFDAAEPYARYAMWAGTDLPAWRQVAWTTNWVWALTPGVLPLLLLLFPTGRPLSWRWAVVVRVAWVELACLVAVLAVLPGPLESFPTVTNPLGWSLLDRSSDLTAAVLGILFIGMETLTLLGLVALAVRYRRATGDERLQLKWIAWGAGVLVVSILVLPYVSDLVVVLGEILGGIALLAAIAAAMLKYRLYEIDRIVSRTLTYAVVTALLAAVYAVGIVALRPVLTPVTGDSDLAVAGSTLVVAALFGPVRRQVQAVVDHRFNRRQYDASRAVATFGQRLRDEVHLDALVDDLRVTVGATIEPTSVSVWLPDESSP